MLRLIGSGIGGAGLYVFQGRTFGDKYRIPGNGTPLLRPAGNRGWAEKGAAAYRATLADNGWGTGHRRGSGRKSLLPGISARIPGGTAPLPAV